MTISGSFRVALSSGVLALAWFQPTRVVLAQEAAPAVVKAEEHEDVNVRGKAFRDVGGSAHALSQKQMERFRYSDPHQVLLQIPGVYVRQEDGFGLRPNIGVRGANSDRSKKITLMEDGVLFAPAPYSAPAAYYFPNIVRMRNVRLIKGPAAIVYGPQTVGGALDLVTNEIPSARAAAFDVGVGNFGSAKVYGRAGLSDEHLGVLVEGLHLTSTGFKELDHRATEPRPDTGFSRNEWMVKVSYVPDPQARVQNTFGLKLNYANEVSNETYLGLTDTDFRASPYRRYSSSSLDKMSWNRTGIAATHDVVFSRSFRIKSTAYRNDLDRTWNRLSGIRGGDISTVLADPGAARNRALYSVLSGRADSSSAGESLLIGPNHRVFVSTGIQSEATWNTKTGPIEHKLVYGARLHHDSVDRRHTRDGYQTVQGKLVSDGTPTEVTVDELGATSAFAMHALDTATWNRLTVSPGIRVELIRSSLENRLTGATTTRSVQIVLPGVGAYYGVTKDFGVLAGVHKGSSPPPAGDRNSRPESSTNYEAGVRYANRKVRAELIGFYNDYQNFTSICTFSTNCSEKNIDKQIDGGRALIYGFESFVETSFKPGNGYTIPARATYTLTDNRFLTNFSSNDPQFGNVKRGDELPYIPTHQANGSTGLEHNQWGVNIAATYVGDMRETAGQGTPRPQDLTDGYFLLDASAHVKPWPFMTLYADGRNLTDSRYLVSRRPFGARPGAPLTVQFGMRLTY
jgi:Fe(3+) dicitrate transport protein